MKHQLWHHLIPEYGQLDQGDEFDDFARAFLAYLIVVDAHTKCSEIQEMKNTTAKAIEGLRHLFSWYGFPEQ